MAIDARSMRIYLLYVIFITLLPPSRNSINTLHV